MEFVKNYIGNWHAGKITTGTLNSDGARILIGGDVCPLEQAGTAIKKGCGHEIFFNLGKVIEHQSLSIVDLECPLTNYDTPTPKTGPNLKAHPICASELRRAGVDVVTLANNHILDMGEKGLSETLDYCMAAGLKTVGAGRNIAEASKPLIVTVNGLQIAILNFAENEWSIATAERPGASPFDFVHVFYQIQGVRDMADFILIIFHGGTEFYSLPSPSMKKNCRFLVDVGAQAVICHHTHVPSGIEVYKGAPIVYSMGNLLFDWHKRREDQWYQGYLVELFIGTSTVHSISLLPYTQCNPRPGIDPMPESQARMFLQHIEGLSDIISEEGILEEKWSEFCRSNQFGYESAALCLSSIEKILYRYAHIWPFWRTDSRRIRTLCNMIRCESHRELLLQALVNRIGNT